MTIEEPEKVNVENLLNNAIFQKRKTMLDDTKTHFFNQQSENIQWEKYVTFDDDSFFNTYEVNNNLTTNDYTMYRIMKSICLNNAIYHKEDMGQVK